MPPTRKTPLLKKPAEKKLADRAREVGRNCLGYTARTFARKVTQTYEARLAPLGLTLSQFMTLNLIAGSTDDTLSALAEAARLDPSTLTRNLQGLEKLELVEVASVEQDQRKRAVWLTEAGVRKLEAAMPAWDQAQAEVAKKLGPSFRAELRRAELAL